ncbi:hypothetical protein H072_7320 [Dactylellina haptotyla CBS 200.50]|uniref:Uncharacterized protein n=1 Tax=Dactylellina haptotyla (strain CBS 200.50) TaxID=1284197 RepID=S8A7H0_DACHA|nr:hypothetical protein H072_7320 [Dactylellina haptotyla CBS 200.50]
MGRTSRASKYARATGIAVLLAVTSISAVQAATVPFYMVVRVPIYSSVPPYHLLSLPAEIPTYLVVPRVSKVDPTTGTQSKYFFLTPLTSIDATTLEQSKFWYDTSTRTVYSETIVPQLPGSGGQDISIGLTTSIEDDFALNSAGAELDLTSSAGAIIPDAIVNSVININNAAAAAQISADSGAELPPPSAVVNLTSNFNTVVQRWEVFADVDLPTGEMNGAMRAAYLEADGATDTDEVQDIYSGSAKLQWKMFMGIGTGEAEDQLWLWRCGLPLGENTLSIFPDMDAAGSTASFKDISYLLLVRPKFKDAEMQIPANFDSWDFDGMHCYKIEPWRNVLAVPLSEMGDNLEGIQQGTYHPEIAGKALQILDGGDSFGGSKESADMTLDQGWTMVD